MPGAVADDKIATWRMSMRLFGWAISGDLLEPSAHVAEGYGWAIPRVQWDHDQAWLGGIEVVQYGEDRRPARPWAALPWLTEHSLRHHIDWPGL